jgi:hypothetical protein
MVNQVIFFLLAYKPYDWPSLWVKLRQRDYVGNDIPWDNGQLNPLVDHYLQGSELTHSHIIPYVRAVS